MGDMVKEATGGKAGLDTAGTDMAGGRRGASRRFRYQARRAEEGPEKFWKGGRLGGGRDGIGGGFRGWLPDRTSRYRCDDPRSSDLVVPPTVMTGVGQRDVMRSTYYYSMA